MHKMTVQWAGKAKRPFIWQQLLVNTCWRQNLHHSIGCCYLRTTAGCCVHFTVGTKYRRGEKLMYVISRKIIAIMRWLKCTVKTMPFDEKNHFHVVLSLRCPNRVFTLICTPKLGCIHRLPPWELTILCCYENADTVCATWKGDIQVLCVTTLSLHWCYFGLIRP